MSNTPNNLAEPAREWIAAQVATGAWPDADAYLNDLVSRDRAEAEQLAVLHAALDEGDTSELSDMSIEDIFATARARNLRAKA